MQPGKIRVVIVDDHPLVRQTWKMILESTDRIDVVRECNDGGDAIDSALELMPDVILMDINMSPVNGFEATRQILKHSPHLKIIGISVNNQPSYARNIIQLGAKGYVTKNSTKEEMVQAINEVAEGKTYICDEVLLRMKS